MSPIERHATYQKRCSGCPLEDFPYTLSGSATALHVVLGANLLSHSLSLKRDDDMSVLKEIFGALRKTYLLRADGPLPTGSQVLNSLGVVPQIQLASDQDDRQAVAEVQDFGDPL
jgi:hypothetical protein